MDLGADLLGERQGVRPLATYSRPARFSTFVFASMRLKIRTAAMTQASSSRDPLELERLAEELAERELRSPRSKDFYSEQEHDLPAYIPLSHGNPNLSAENFDVEAFLLSRSYTSLPDLRAELRDYLAVLKEELVKLINDDYEAFISLSTDLRGEGTRLEKLKSPLAGLRSEVLESRNELQRIQDAVQLKLQKRSNLREEKAFLHLLLKISESVTRLESLLLIATPSEDEQNSTEFSVGTLKGSTRAGHHEDSLDDRSRTNRAKHLSRVAAEYTQLLYHVSKAKSDTCAFVDECQWRIDRIRSTLSSDLDYLFSTTVRALTDSKLLGKDHRPSSESEKAKLITDVTECLRTYDSLGLWRDAEEVLRRDVIHEFVKKTIHPAALSTPHSPLVPHTPFPASRQPSQGPDTFIPLRTPYTPFTAFASKQNPFEMSFEAGGVSAIHAHLLDDSDDPLAGLYNQILKFVERDMKRIMEVAEKVSVKNGLPQSTSKGEARAHLLGPSAPSKSQTSQDKDSKFEIMANVVWAELGKAIMEELGHVVFAVGKPDEFRKHHETTQAFIRSLEFLAPSVQAVKAMRAHPIYNAFERRWQLPVYFQLRWKEIVIKLEESLAVTRLERTPGKAPFATAQGAATWEAISSCWSAQIFIPELGHRFWKLTLQLLSRYKLWMENSLPPIDASFRSAGAGSAVERRGNMSASSASGTTRAGTPTIPAEAAPPESVAADEALVAQLAIAITDIKAVETQVWKLWHEELSIMLPDTSAVTEGDNASLEDALRHSLSKFLSIIPPLSGQIIHILSRRGCDALLPMRSIPSQFRAMSSSKRLPTEPSHFVSLIFRPLKAFFGIGAMDGPAAELKGELLASYTEEVFEAIAQRYIYFLTAMKKTEESLRRLKKGKKSTFSLFGGGAGKDDEGRADEEKIRAQMILDVEAFGKDAASLGVAVDNSATYQALKDLAHSSLAEDS
ncbi:unnamed protein product [Somion occarium]|uniref:Conserved oligomeric Golgi complex subunit 2 n=1 Tax=Somion occarium TaxID=3059160 RepID=A0ABP1DHF2_9APHY